MDDEWLEDVSSSAAGGSGGGVGRRSESSAVIDLASDRSIDEQRDRGIEGTEETSSGVVCCEMTVKDPRRPLLDDAVGEHRDGDDVRSEDSDDDDDAEEQGGRRVPRGRRERLRHQLSKADALVERLIDEKIRPMIVTELEGTGGLQMYRDGTWWVRGPVPVLQRLMALNCGGASKEEVVECPPDVLVLIPHLLMDAGHVLRCADCGGVLTRSGYPTNPKARRVQDIFRSFYVYTCRYRCEHCKTTTTGTSWEIIKQLPQPVIEDLPFRFLHRSAISLDLFRLIGPLSANGTGRSEIADKLIGKLQAAHEHDRRVSGWLPRLVERVRRGRSGPEIDEDAWLQRSEDPLAPEQPVTEAGHGVSVAEASPSDPVGPEHDASNVCHGHVEADREVMEVEPPTASEPSPTDEEGVHVEPIAEQPPSTKAPSTKAIDALQDPMPTKIPYVFIQKSFFRPHATSATASASRAPSPRELKFCNFDVATMSSSSRGRGCAICGDRTVCKGRGGKRFCWKFKESIGETLSPYDLAIKRRLNSRASTPNSQ